MCVEIRGKKQAMLRKLRRWPQQGGRQLQVCRLRLDSQGKLDGKRTAEKYQLLEWAPGWDGQARCVFEPNRGAESKFAHQVRELQASPNNREAIRT